MVGSSLELVQTQCLNVLPTCMITLLLSNDRMSEIKNESFSGLDHLMRSVLLLDPIIVSVVHCHRQC